MRLKLIFLLSIILLGFCATAQKPKIEVSYSAIPKKEVSFTLDYSNLGRDTLVVWIQNWRVILLEDKNAKFRGFPHTSNLVNFLFVLNDSISLLDQLSSVEYSAPLEVNVAQVSMKKIAPNAHFIVNLSLSDKKLFKFLKNEVFKTNFIMGYASLDSLRKIDNFESIKFYMQDSIDLAGLPVTGNSYQDVMTTSFTFSNEKGMVPVSAFDLNKIFKKGIAEEPPVNMTKRQQGYR